MESGCHVRASHDRQETGGELLAAEDDRGDRETLWSAESITWTSAAHENAPRYDAAPMPLRLFPSALLLLLLLPACGDSSHPDAGDGGIDASALEEIQDAGTDFGARDLESAVRAFHGRERRFGGLPKRAAS